ncbi:unnamed protein product [Ectocarpus sp. CCAP 1310/34]|nr:unnamed protein product [Ectocarpus sp. CCAP 1310/34]
MGSRSRNHPIRKCGGNVSPDNNTKSRKGESQRTGCGCKAGAACVGSAALRWKVVVMQIQG